MSVDAYYKKMMLWLGVALVASLVVAMVVVGIVMHVYGAS